MEIPFLNKKTPTWMKVLGLLMIAVGLFIAYQFGFKKLTLAEKGTSELMGGTVKAGDYLKDFANSLRNNPLTNLGAFGTPAPKV